MMRAIADTGSTLLAFNPPDREAFRDRIDRLSHAFGEAYRAQREEYGVTVAPCDDPLWSSHCRLSGAYQYRIDKIERALRQALASDGLSDDDRARILTAAGIRARDAKLLSAAEGQHITDYRALDEPDRRIIRDLISRLAKGGTR